MTTGGVAVPAIRPQCLESQAFMSIRSEGPKEGQIEKSDPKSDLLDRTSGVVLNPPKRPGITPSVVTDSWPGPVSFAGC